MALTRRGGGNGTCHAAIYLLYIQVLTWMRRNGGFYLYFILYYIMLSLSGTVYKREIDKYIFNVYSFFFYFYKFKVYKRLLLFDKFHIPI